MRVRDWFRNPKVLIEWDKYKNLLNCYTLLNSKRETQLKHSGYMKSLQFQMIPRPKEIYKKISSPHTYLGHKNTFTRILEASLPFCLSVNKISLPREENLKYLTPIISKKCFASCFTTLYVNTGTRAHVYIFIKTLVLFSKFVELQSKLIWRGILFTFSVLWGNVFDEGSVDFVYVIKSTGFLCQVCTG